MKLSLEILQKLDPCSDGLAWWMADKCKTVESTIKKLFAADKLDWANWLIARVLSHDNQIKYAIYAAQQVLNNYEKQYPDDARARRAEEAAETYLKNKTEENRQAALAAAYAYAAYAAANVAANAMKKKIIEYGVSLLQTRQTPHNKPIARRGEKGKG